LIGLLKGLKTTLKAFFTRPVTVIYPYRKMEIAPRGQGLIRLRMKEVGARPVYKCEACGVCAKNCPQQCITVKKKLDEKQPEVYEVDYSMCIFCRICIDNCPFDALEQTQEYEWVGETRDYFIHDKEDLAMSKTIKEVEERE
jgi:formate hydrogenlyase subunit 6/NADH:ubiquinone oxidoreductase subunit I